MAKFLDDSGVRPLWEKVKEKVDAAERAAKAASAPLERAVMLKRVSTNLPYSTHCTSVVYGINKFVALFSGADSAAYSNDGTNWTTTPMPAMAKWKTITFGRKGFAYAYVALPIEGTLVAYSLDGVKWTATNMPESGNWEHISYGNGRFVAVATIGSKTAYSDDGKTWTLGALPQSIYWGPIAYGGGKFAVVAFRDLESDGAQAAYSEDGITWTETTLPIDRDWTSMAYGDGKFVAIAKTGGNEGIYSADGITWAPFTLPFSATWYSIAYGNGLFVAIARGGDKAAYSRDGINWSETRIGLEANWNSVAFGKGRFVAVSHSRAEAAYSEDGINWVSGTTTTYVDSDGKELTGFTPGDLTAEQVAFSDGETFQQKYDAGELTGPAGAIGPTGKDGGAGPQGPAGPAGKSAYAQAVEAGYTGTEAAFYAALVSLKDGPFLPLSGGTMTGTLDTGNHPLKIGPTTMICEEYSAEYHLRFLDETYLENIGYPTSPTDAANKEYVDSKTMVFSEKTIATTAWVSNSTYSAQGYAYRASVACAGVAVSHRPDVAFSAADAVSGNFAPVAESYAGGVYIYCKEKPTATVTIPSIVCVRGA